MMANPGSASRVFPRMLKTWVTVSRGYKYPSVYWRQCSSAWMCPIVPEQKLYGSLPQASGIRLLSSTNLTFAASNDKKHHDHKSQQTKQRRMPPPEEEYKRRMDENYEDFLKTMKALRADLSTIPNLISVSRLASTGIICPLILSMHYTPALVIFTIASISDVVDGYIARKYPSQASVSGTFLDPVADKVLIGATAVCLSLSMLMPLGLTLTIVGRDMLLFGGAILLRFIALPYPKNKRAFFTLDMKVKPSIISKGTTFFQSLAVIASLGAPVFGYVNHWMLTDLYLVAAGVTFISGMSYLVRPGVIDHVSSKERPRQF